MKFKTQTAIIKEVSKVRTVIPVPVDQEAWLGINEQMSAYERSLQYQKLLIGVKWGSFMTPAGGVTLFFRGAGYKRVSKYRKHKRSVHFKFRVGFYFRIPAFAIICGKDYVVLRRLKITAPDTEHFGWALLSDYTRDNDLNGCMGQWYKPTYRELLHFLKDCKITTSMCVLEGGITENLLGGSYE